MAFELLTLPNMTAWTREYEATEMMESLQEVGIAAGVVLYGAGVLSGPHLAAHEFLLTIEKEEAGPHFYPGFVPRFSDMPSVVRWPAPSFGKHNERIFGSLLGLSKAEMQQLSVEGVISTEPLFPSPTR